MRLRNTVVATAVVVAVLIPATVALAVAEPDTPAPAAAVPSPRPEKVLNTTTATAAPVPVPDVPDGISADKVLVIGLDGLRHDRIAAAHAPNLDSLTARGTFGTSLLYTSPMAVTSSGPGWSTIATGTWPDKHKVKDNTFAGKRYDLYPDFLTRLEGIDPGYSTYAATDWKSLGDQGTFGAGVDARIVLNGDSDGYPAEDERITRVSERVLRNRNPDVAFVYLGSIDIAGHGSGAGSRAYLNAISTVDAQIGRLLAAVRARSTYTRERWTVIVTTDHGHTDAGGHGGSTVEERRTFVLATGPGIAAGATPSDTRMVDVAATVFGQLGLPLPAELDGKSIARRSTDPFDYLSLGKRVHELRTPATVKGFTHTAPIGWSVDNRGLPAGGVREWRGWSFTTDEFWSRAQRNQWRELFVRGRGVFAVADSDEWDDRFHGTGTFNSTLVSPPYLVSGRDTVKIGFLTHYRQAGAQKAQVLVSFDGGPRTVVKTYTADAVAKAESVPVAVPAGALNMTVRFRYSDAGNDWYWAIDDLRIT
ncbi:alkaline phosphatase family protein [Streptosporangium sp. NPDC000396]|uniref:alkaline phosphatase family protein n=1 Tax=Streptosporangium sp. NPDC000396 TaxID=3366185 RepID=UPI0036A18743